MGLGGGEVDSEEPSQPATPELELAGQRVVIETCSTVPLPAVRRA